MSSTSQLQIADADDGREEDVIAVVMEKCIGQINRWQICVFLLVFLVNIPLSMQELAIVFLAPKQDFWCVDETIDKCSDKCPEIIYDTSIFERTITSQWGLVCDREWLAEFSQTLLMSGVFVGHIIFGILADKYGRRKPLVAAVFMEVIVGAGIAFVPYLWLFEVLRFLVAVAAGGTLVTGFVIVVEIIGETYRPYFGILFQMTYYIGHSMLGLLAYFLRDWRVLQLTISIPTIVLISYYWLLPESPRWLLSTNRRTEAIKVMQKAQIFNKKPLSHIGTTVRAMELKDPPEEHFFDLFKTRNIRKKTLILYFNWVVLGVTFFGVAQYLGKVVGDIFVNVIIGGLIQIPGNGILLYLINRRGRKFCAMGSYFLCGLSCVCIAFVPTEPTWITTFLASISMMSISLAFATVFLWSGELFPTVVRNVGVGSSAVFAKVGSMVAPFIANLHGSQAWIAPIIFGSGPILALLACILLPETLHTVMPDTVEDAEEFGKRS